MQTSEIFLLPNAGGQNFAAIEIEKMQLIRDIYLHVVSIQIGVIRAFVVKYS